jgi:hypothetical protein
MQKKILIGIVAAIIVLAIVGLIFITKGDLSKASPIKVIKYSDENSTIEIIANSLTKEATIEIKFLLDDETLHPDFFGERGDTTEFMTTMSCGLMSMAFFDKEALEEFNQQISEWNEMNGVVEDEGGKEIGEPEENPLEGYEITKATVILRNKDAQSKVSQCVITGAEEGDIEVTYY